jgi:hypothetical protein
MSWDRATCAKALVTLLGPALPGVSVYDRPMYSYNAPAVIVGRAAETRYSTFAIGIDETQLPLTVAVGTEREDDVSDLMAQIRSAIEGDNSLGGTVASCTAALDRNWRNTKVAGADLLAADLVLQVYM